jgi:hypothetical protein
LHRFTRDIRGFASPTNATDIGIPVISAGPCRTEDGFIEGARRRSASQKGKSKMTELTQAQRKNPSTLLIGAALAASILGGIVGGLVGTSAQTLVERAAADQARAAAAEQAKWDAYGAEWERLHREQRSRYLSSRDQAVLEAAREWEARQREMYPISN